MCGSFTRQIYKESISYNNMKEAIHPGKRKIEIRSRISNDLKTRLLNTKFKKEYQGKELNIFVGRFGYPQVNVGFLGNEQVDEIFDSPKQWVKQKFGISTISALRSSLINSRFKTNIKDFKNKLLEQAQEVALSSNAVDMEINLEKQPKRILSLHKHSIPTGPASTIKNVKISSNPSIDEKVDYITSDTDLKAGEGILTLYKKGFDELFLTKILSTGNLGLKYNRKIVPTRWSITATDDTIGKQLITEISKYPACDIFSTFGGHLGNFYITLFFPGEFSYELFEIEPDSGGVWTDHETSFGRKTYASNCVGGYYANRLAILEKLKKLKRSASVLSIRFITDQYYQPLGVWVVREASRKALTEREINFYDKKLMIKYAIGLAKKYFNYDLTEILSQSKLLKSITYQKRLNEFFN